MKLYYDTGYIRQRENVKNLKINHNRWKEVSGKFECSQMKVSNINIIITLYLEWLLGHGLGM